jgi:hypothetical protein
MIMLKVPPLSEDGCLCKTSKDVNGHDSDGGWLCEVGLHGASLRSPPCTPNSDLCRLISPQALGLNLHYFWFDVWARALSLHVEVFAG